MQRFILVFVSFALTALAALCANGLAAPPPTDAHNCCRCGPNDASSEPCAAL